MEVLISKTAAKQLRACPDFIARKFDYWLDLIAEQGLIETRKYKGFHDEPLKGKRSGQRSVRLSKSYRIFYRELDRGTFEIIEVLEVNKHEY